MKRVPLTLAAHAVGVRPCTIRKWIERGRLTRHPDGIDLLELLIAVDGRDEDALMARAGLRKEHRPRRVA